MAVDVWKIRTGDHVRESGSPHRLTVVRIDPPGSGGRARQHGPMVHAQLHPGGYGTSFDAETADRFKLAY